jgi:esterase
LRINVQALRDSLCDLGAFPFTNEQWHGETLFLCGAKSEYPIHRNQTFFTNAAVKIIPNAGHWVHSDNPSDFIKACLEFFQKY